MKVRKPCPSCGRPATLRKGRKTPDRRYCRRDRPPKAPAYTVEEETAARLEVHRRRAAGVRWATGGGY